MTKRQRVLMEIEAMRWKQFHEGIRVQRGATEHDAGQMYEYKVVPPGWVQGDE